MHSTSDKRSGQNSFVKNLGKQPRENHFHLLLRTPQANLSRFMQRLNTSYALYARYKHRKPGHQFEARFKAKLVQDDDYLLAATRYIHLNPIKTAACRRMTKAQRPGRPELGATARRRDPGGA
ncbi:MAG: transposase [Thermoguttaceae bacterium]